MSWLLALLLRAGGLLRAAVQWLFVKPGRLLVVIALVVMALQQYKIGNLRDELTASQLETETARQATDDLADDVELATAQAAAADHANRVRIEGQWRAALQEASRENQTLRERNRNAVAEFVRRQSAAAPGVGGGPAADLPGTATLPSRAVHDATTAVVPIEDLQRCADAYAQLAALITVWQTASGVDVNGDFNGDEAPVQLP